MRTLYSIVLFVLISTSTCLAHKDATLPFIGGEDSISDVLFGSEPKVPRNVIAKSLDLQMRALRSGDSLLLANSFLMEGKARYELGQVSRAISKLSEAQSVFLELDIEFGVIASLYEIGVIEASSGLYFQSLLRFKKCLNSSKENSFENIEPWILYQIASINFKQGEYPLAAERLHEANAIASAADYRLKVQLEVLSGLLAIANNEYSAADNHFENAEEIARKKQDSSCYSMIYSGYAQMYLSTNELQRALRNSEDAIRLSAFSRNPYFRIENLLILSDIQLSLGNHEEALTAANEAYLESKTLENAIALRGNTLQYLSQIHLALGDTLRAFKYLSSSNTIRDSINNNRVNRFVLLPSQEQTELKEPIANKTKTEELLPADQASMVIIGGLIFLCALLTLVIFRKASMNPKVLSTSTANLGTTYDFSSADNAPNPAPAAPQPSVMSAETPGDRSNSKDIKEIEAKYQEQVLALEKQLEDQKKQAEEKQTTIDAKNKYFEEMDRTKNKVFSVLTHDLRQPINQIKSVLNLLEMDELDGEDRKQIVEKLKESVDNSSNALENLLLWSKKQLTGINTTIVDVHLLPQVWQLESQLKPSLEAKGLKFKINIPDFFKVKADMNQLDICMRNLLTNAIKFSNPGGTITIDAIEENGQKIIRMIDKGVGMTPEQLEQMQGVKDNFTTLGTMNEKGTGLGILITREFMENQEGRLDIMSRKGEGSIFSLVFSSGSATRNPQLSESNKM